MYWRRLIHSTMDCATMATYVIWVIPSSYFVTTAYGHCSEDKRYLLNLLFRHMKADSSDLLVQTSHVNVSTPPVVYLCTYAYNWWLVLACVYVWLGSLCFIHGQHALALQKLSHASGCWCETGKGVIFEMKNCCMLSRTASSMITFKRLPVGPRELQFRVSEWKKCRRGRLETCWYFCV